MELISPQTDGDILPIQVIGITETDVFCIFLGKVWKMKCSVYPEQAPSAPLVLEPAQTKDTVGFDSAQPTL